ncbi:MAG: PE domain-containing protein [Gordonia amarae]
MITNVVPSALLGSVGEVVSNTVTTATVVDGGSVLMCSAAPAGSDEASVLASANTTAHTANFLAVASTAFVEMGRFAGALGAVSAGYEVVDDANGAQFI